MRITGIERKYKGQWVVVEVTRVSKEDEPLAGKVLFHSKSRSAAERRAKPSFEKDIYVFYCGPPVPEGWAFQMTCGSAEGRP